MNLSCEYDGKTGWKYIAYCRRIKGELTSISKNVPEMRTEKPFTGREHGGRRENPKQKGKRLAKEFLGALGVLCVTGFGLFTPSERATIWKFFF
jgi:hypothetical protein